MILTMCGVKLRSVSRAGKRILLAVTVAALLGSSYPVYVVGVALNLWNPLTRPLAVPRRATHVNAFKSAAWFDCGVDSHRNVDVCRAWDEQGHLIAFGNYRIDGQDRAANNEELRPWSVRPGPNHNPRLAWIHRSDGGSPLTLVPVDHAGRPLERFEVR